MEAGGKPMDSLVYGVVAFDCEGNIYEQCAKVSIVGVPDNSYQQYDFLNEADKETMCEPLTPLEFGFYSAEVTEAKTTCVESDTVAKPNKIIDIDFLSIEDVAQVLNCTERTIQLIPNDQLIFYPGPGRGNIYLREDIKIYLKNRLVKNQVTDKVIQKALNLPVDGRRKRSRKGERT
jgi:hypothetical protein